MEKEVSEVDRKLLLRRTYLDKIHYYITRNPINQDELYVLIRKFFGEYLKIDYEFTYEELSSELTKVFITPKVKEHIDDFLIRLSECEYLEETTLGTKEINAYLEEFEDIIQNIIYDDKPPQKEEESLLKRVLKKHKEEIYDLSKVSSMIEEINFHITSGNLDTAKTSYVTLLKAFDSLPKEDKKKIHEELNEIYMRLQTLQKNPRPQANANVQQSNVNAAVKKVFDSVDDTLYYVNASNIESAKKLYSDTLTLYDGLNQEEKNLAHLRVNDAYSQLQALIAKAPKADGSADESGEEKQAADKDKDHPDDKGEKAQLLQTDSNEGTLQETSSMLNLQLSQSDAGGSDTLVKGISDKDQSINHEQFDFTKDIQPSVFEPVPKSVQPAVEQFDVFGRSIGAERVQATTKTIAPAQTTNLAQTTDQHDSLAAREEVSLQAETSDRASKSKALKKQPKKDTKDAKKDTADAKDTKTKLNQDASNIVLKIDDMISKHDGHSDEKIDVHAGQKSVSQNNKNDEPYAVKRLYEMLKKIDDDLILDKLENAKSTYKEALSFYKAMTNENKAKCYTRFFDAFNRLDAALHKRSLSEILDKHLDDSSTQRPVSKASDTEHDKLNDVSFDKASRMSTLPILVANDEGTTRVYELVEEAYFNIEKRNMDIAMLKYFSALELYHSLPVGDKKKLYRGLYELFTRLSASRKK